MNRYLGILSTGQSLSRSEAKAACSLILNDGATSESIVKLLQTLHQKPETEAEILGFLDAIQETTPAFPSFEQDLMDVCGTGGDGAQTFNVSTGVAIVLASLGIKIAKHGNRGVSSRSGSSDVLQALQIKNDGSTAEVKESLTRLGISFLFAPAFYPVLAKIAPIRRSISGPTLFNALGPLLNPAPLTHQLMGVYDEALLIPCAEVLRAKGLKRAFIVHGVHEAVRLDEFTLSGLTQVAALENDEIRRFTLTPEDFGLNRAPPSTVQGGTPEENAQILIQIFNGEKFPKRDLIVINAAAGLVLSGLEKDYKIAAKRVENALDTGVTLKLMESIQKRTQAAS